MVWDLLDTFLPEALSFGLLKNHHANGDSVKKCPWLRPRENRETGVNPVR
jgi:hypothetical protein